MKRTIIVLLIGLVLGVVLSTRLTFPSHAATAGRYAAFAGNYWLHDGRITIRPSGWGLFSYGYLYTCPHGVGTCRFAGYVGTAAPPWCLHHSGPDGRVILCLSPAPPAAKVHGTISVRWRVLPFPGSTSLALPASVSRTMTFTGVLEGRYATSTPYALELGATGRTLFLDSSYLPPQGGRVVHWFFASEMHGRFQPYFLDPGR